MRIAVFGLGNVGLVAALGLCEQGHEVVGIDINSDKISHLLKHRTYIFEDGLSELLLKHRARFYPSEVSKDLRGIDCFLICVGSPALSDGEVSLDQVEATCKEVAGLLKYNPGATVILRSTVPPGTVDELVLPLMNQSAADFRFAYHPEFLREGSAVQDFLFPHLHVVGLIDPEGELPCADLFANAERLMKVPIRSAEMLKYINNGYHALKVAFANEVASLASAMDVPIEPLFESFFADTKLNISRSYLRPGFAFGGPCLTKELSALQQLSRRHQISAPLIGGISQSNEAHIRRTFEKIERLKPRSIVVFGVSFKSGTDDVRSSPVLDLIGLLKKRPKYLPQRLIWVSDLAGAMERIGEDGLTPFTGVPEIEPDCIILGSTQLTLEQIEWIRVQKCRIFDMCLSKSSENLAGADIVRPYEV